MGKVITSPHPRGAPSTATRQMWTALLAVAMITNVTSATLCSSTDPLTTFLSVVSYSNCNSASAVTISAALSIQFSSSTFAGLSLVGAFSSLSVTIEDSVFTGMSSGEAIRFTGAHSSGTLAISGSTFSSASTTEPLLRFMGIMSSYTITVASSTLTGNSEVFRHQAALSSSTVQLSGSTTTSGKQFSRCLAGASASTWRLLSSTATHTLDFLTLEAGTSSSLSLSVVSTTVTAASLMNTAISISTANVVISGTASVPSSIVAGTGFYCSALGASCTRLTMTSTYAALSFTSGGPAFGAVGSSISIATVTFGGTVTLHSVVFACNGTATSVTVTATPSSASWSAPLSTSVVYLGPTCAATGLLVSVSPASATTITFSGSTLFSIGGTVTGASLTVSNVDIVCTGPVASLLSIGGASAIVSSSITFLPSRIALQASSSFATYFVAIGAQAALQTVTLSIACANVESLASSSAVVVLHVGASASLTSATKVSIQSLDLRSTVGVTTVASISAITTDDTSMFDSSFVSLKCLQFPRDVSISVLVRIGYLRNTSVALDSVFIPSTTAANGAVVALTNLSSSSASSSMLRFHRSFLHVPIIATDVNSPSCLSLLDVSCTRGSNTLFVSSSSFSNNIAAVATATTLDCSGAPIPGAECNAPFHVSNSASISNDGSLSMNSRSTSHSRTTSSSVSHSAERTSSMSGSLSTSFSRTTHSDTQTTSISATGSPSITSTPTSVSVSRGSTTLTGSPTVSLSSTRSPSSTTTNSPSPTSTRSTSRHSTSATPSTSVSSTQSFSGSRTSVSPTASRTVGTVSHTVSMVDSFTKTTTHSNSKSVSTTETRSAASKTLTLTRHSMTHSPTRSLSPPSISMSPSPRTPTITRRSLTLLGTLTRDTPSKSRTLEFFLMDSNYSCVQQSKFQGTGGAIAAEASSGGTVLTSTVPTTVPLVLAAFNDSRFSCNNPIQIPTAHNESIIECSIEFNITCVVPPHVCPMMGDLSVQFLFRDGTMEELAVLFEGNASTAQIAATEVPTVHAVIGCGRDDAFPNAVSCAHGDSVWIHGAGFSSLSSYELQWHTESSLKVATCNTLVMLSSSEAHCTDISINFTLWRQAAGNASTLPPARTILRSTATSSFHEFPSARLSFVDTTIALLCPTSTTSNCSGHGECTSSGHCACASSAAEGYWGNPSCSTCASTHNASTMCKALCPTANGEICGGAALGFCNDGLCFCYDVGEWVNGTCAHCPSTNGLVCSAHGTCHMVVLPDAPSTSHCTCDAAFTGVSCNECSDGLSGPYCNASCPLGLDGTTLLVVCSGHGGCDSGSCFCVEDFCGPSCSVAVSPSNRSSLCDVCPLWYRFGPSCSLDCPGVVHSGGSTVVCSGHGQCTTGIYGSGQCRCEEGFGRADCSAPCPQSSSDGSICSSHGTCVSLTAQCACASHYGGIACEARCPHASSGEVCHGHGVCDEGNLGSGLCICAAGYGGTDCSRKCPGHTNGGTSCNAHGACSTDGSTCTCYKDGERGYWSGETCDACELGWSGPACSDTCALGANGAVCSGHGTCSNLRCECYASFDFGFWNGDVCGVCASGYYGAECTAECPGGACSPCNSHGTCDDGVAGSGTCACYSTPHQGYWAGESCGTCRTSHFGSSCTSMCPDCGPNGHCLSGVTGTGACTCISLAFQQNKSGYPCSECAPGFFGSRCDACPRGSHNNLPCNGSGSCDDGIGGAGVCRCPVGSGGAACDERSCPADSNNVPCGIGGQCNTTTFACSCRSSRFFQNMSTGLCSTCATGWFGSNCSQRCSWCGFGDCATDGSCRCFGGYWGPNCSYSCPGGPSNPCSGHGICNATTGVCSCSQSMEQGFYAGASCSICNPRYNSTNCNVLCPSIGGAVCSGRGSCFNGACFACKPSPREVGLVVYACGDACQLIDQQCQSIEGGCAYGTFGTNCSQLCPGVASLPAPTNSSCHGSGYCDGATGKCVCAPYASGVACETRCAQDHSTMTYCSGHGYCGSDGQCDCYDGYFNTTCNGRCPQHLNMTCGGRGSCGSISGACDCDQGYAGTACEIECPGGPAAPCYGHGICHRLTGACDCFSDASTGMYGGHACESCATTFTGRTCSVFCDPTRGTVEGTTCECNVGYYGVDCQYLCPRTSSTDGDRICGGHGVCDSIDGGCICNEGYFGTACDVPCSVSLCEGKGFYRPQCDVHTGACVCKDSSTGRWTGLRCDHCASDRWGTECNQACGCNGHGSCNALTGDCECYSDDTLGHYDGPTCSSCDAQFFGLTCRNRNLKYAAAAATVISTQGSDAPRWVAVASRHHLIVYGSPLDAFAAVFLVHLNGSVAPSAVINFSLPTIAAYIITGADATASTIVVVNVNGATESQPLTLGTQTATSERAFRALAANPSLLSVHYLPAPNASTHDAFCHIGLLPINSTWRVLQLVCPGTIIDGGHLNVSTVDWNRVLWYQWSVDKAHLAVVGCTTTAAQWKVVVALLNVTSEPTYNVLDVVGMGEYAPSTAWTWLIACTASNTGTSTNVFTLICASQESNDGGLWLWSFAPATPGTGTLHVLQEFSGLVFAGVNLSSSNVTMASDDGARLGCVSFTPPFYSPVVLVFDIDSMQLNSQHLLPAFPNSIITTIAIDSSNRLLVGSLVDSTSRVHVFTINLFSIASVMPNVVDSHGGATVTVTGFGFVGDVHQYTCLFEGDAQSTAAVVLNSKQLACVVPTTAQSNASTIDACVTQTVNVRYMNQSLRSTAQTELGMLRPTSVVVESLVTAYGAVMYVAEGVATTLTVTGSGFVPSAFASCRIVRYTSASSWVLHQSPATVVNTTAAVCTYVPSTTHHAVPVIGAWQLSFSHDGFTFGPTAPIFSLVGTPAAIVVESGWPSGAAVPAAMEAPIGDLIVNVVDNLGQRRGRIEDVDQTVSWVTCNATLHPIGSGAADELLPVRFTGGATLTGVMQHGQATIRNVTLEKPRAGTLTISCMPASVLLSLPTTLLSITVSSGTPYRLNLKVNEGWRAAVVADVVLSPEPSVWVEDEVGNAITDPQSTLPLLATFTYVEYVSHTYSSVVRTASLLETTNRYAFTGVIVRTLFGVGVNVTVALPALPSVLGTSFVLQPEQCGGNQVAIEKTTDCAPCPSGAVCNGSAAVEVTGGYWRAYSETLVFHKCVPKDACLGGPQCAVGYHGPMCVLCQPGFGRSQSGCVSCFDERINWGVIAGVCIVLVAVLLHITIFSMPATTAEEAAALTDAQLSSGRASIAVKVLISHIQMLAYLEVPTRRDGGNVAPEWLLPIFSSGSSGASIDGFAIVSCLGATTVFDKLIVLLVALPGLLLVVLLVAAVRSQRKSKKHAELSLRIGDTFDDPLSLTSYGRALPSDEERGSPAEDFITSRRPLQDATRTAGRRMPSPRQRTASPKHQRPNPFDTQDCSLSLPSVYSVVSPTSARQSPPRRPREVAHVPQTAGVAQNDAQPRRDGRQRFAHMALVALVGLLFFAYPTVVEYATSILDCTHVSIGPGETVRLMRLDPSVDCESSSYTQKQLVSISALVVFGVGVPLLSVVAVHLVRIVSCQGELRQASAIFYFLTGGYRTEMWFWEGVSLSKKLLLVVVVSVVKDQSLRMLCSVWILIASLLLNAVANPWQDKSLARGEDVSFAVLAASFGFMYWVSVSSYVTSTEEDTSTTLVVLFVAVVSLNVVAIARIVKSVAAGAYADVMHSAAERSSCIARAIDDAATSLANCFWQRQARACAQLQEDVFNTRNPRTGCIDNTALVTGWRRMRRAARKMERESFTQRILLHRNAARDAFGEDEDEDGNPVNNGTTPFNASPPRSPPDIKWVATDTFYLLCVRVGKLLAIRRCIAFVWRSREENLDGEDPYCLQEWFTALFSAERSLVASIVVLQGGQQQLHVEGTSLEAARGGTLADDLLVEELES